MTRVGPEDGPVVAWALPLFEEANRTRAVAVAAMRALADRGIASALPELPGQGESLVPTQATTLFGLREGFEGAVATLGARGRPVYVAAVRSGALLDLFALAHGRWHLSPQDGPALLRELTRVKQAEAGSSARPGDRWPFSGLHPVDARDPPVSIAGNLVAPHLLHELTTAILYDAPEPPMRTVRLAGDPRPADAHLTGAPPWRRAEPGQDRELSQRLASDIADWLRTCDAH